MMGKIIELQNIVKMTADGNRVINNVNFTIQESDCVEFSGASMSRAALMRLIAGMDKPSSGCIYVQDKPLHEMSDNHLADLRNRIFGIVQSDPCFLPMLSVLENVALPLTIWGEAVPDRKQRAFEQMESLAIQYLVNAMPAQLSSYERMLVSVARALMTGPKILLLYEVEANLTATEADRFMEHLRSILYTREYTVLTFVESCNPKSNAGIQYKLSHGTIQEVNG